jgi:prephenate dehydrogenase
MELKKFHFIALGLIGGSIAKAIRKACPDAVINAYARHPEKLKAGLEDKTLDRVTDIITDLDFDTDVVFLCAPTGSNLENLEALSKNEFFMTQILPRCLITDVGSVKSDIQKKADSLGLSEHFLGGHPMTGKEKSGYDNADDAILENAYYILTPSDKTEKKYTDEFEELVKLIHAIPLKAAPDEHDKATAAISHVPHLIAASLVKSVKDNDNEEHFMKTIAAGGFKDITRIASSDPAMWKSICKSNTDNIRDFLHSYIAELNEVDKMLAENRFDDIADLFSETGKYRSSMTSKGRGPLPEIFRIFVDIPDEPGAIAGIAALLALRKISIKNTGINHNREQAEGALYIEFYDEASMRASLPLIKAAGYSVLVDE